MGVWITCYCAYSSGAGSASAVGYRARLAAFTAMARASVRVDAGTFADRRRAGRTSATALIAVFWRSRGVFGRAKRQRGVRASHIATAAVGNGRNRCLATVVCNRRAVGPAWLTR